MQIKSLFFATFTVIVGATAVAASLDPASSVQLGRRNHMGLAHRYTGVIARDESSTDPTTPTTPATTGDPTCDPTADPTCATQAATGAVPNVGGSEAAAPADPNADPTADPTVDPTVDPKVDPTVDPNVDPSQAVAAADPSKNVTQVANKVNKQVTAPLLEIAAAVDLNIDLSGLLQAAEDGLNLVLGIVGELLKTVLSLVRRADDPTSAVSGAAQSAASDAAGKAVNAAQDAAQTLLSLNVDLEVNVDLGDLLQSVFSLLGQLVQSLSQIVPSILDVCSGPLKMLTSLVGQLLGEALNPLTSILGGIL
ncbi:hypothetical protein CF327_g1472 [Tilletia walkeri]|uniref:Uncharacterized protein n=1 Tax=Tilletia walkeri TaxID=117179 RepID=A0A8X7NDE2_9BASI|nr:hypothetical protein CF327_g1472 [Tilletia walkeri]KAE8271219.1 hypothetical protein A4X09_0g1109 [Tilletia walkeri]